MKKIRSLGLSRNNIAIFKYSKIIDLSMKTLTAIDEFLYKIQQPKMKELWDNKEDEDWEKF